MYLLAWIVIGAVVGWGAGRVLEGNGYGPLMDTLLGIGGGIVGGFLTRVAGFEGYGGTIVTSLVAMVGAALLMLAAYANGRRAYARQLLRTGSGDSD
jgi:uncharacterized membrane protein YeaQ/YmgE (transglycosylase-associated protein family)